MRRLVRPDLDPRLAAILQRLQDLVDAGTDAERIWKRARSTSLRPVAQVLGQMTGRRERCMYCEDSRATDIEHFWPRRSYPAKIFVWLNLLWICSGCNRSKAARFSLDEDGLPLLINPTAEDPWNFLFYDSATGELAARWHEATGLEDRKGRETLELLSTLRHEAVVEGRMRIYRALVRAVRTFLASTYDAAALAELLDAVADCDDAGLATWFFLREGSEEPPFSILREQHPWAWAAIVKRLS